MKSTKTATTRKVRRVAGRTIATVSRSEVIAAQGRILTDQRQGKQTPEWVRKVAAAGTRRRLTTTMRPRDAHWAQPISGACPTSRRTRRTFLSETARSPRSSAVHSPGSATSAG